MKRIKMDSDDDPKSDEYDDVKLNQKNLIPFFVRERAKDAIDLNVDEFLRRVKNERIVIISDVHGSGKKTFLKKLCESLHEKYPTHLICTVDVKKRIKIFVKTPHTDFIKFVCQSFADASKFMDKFKNGKVKIILDGFADLSFGLSLKISNLMINFSTYNSNQVFITTSVFLEENFVYHIACEGVDKFFAAVFQLKSFNEDEQVKFLLNSWKNKRLSSKMIQKYSALIVQNLTKLTPSFSEVFGLPLILGRILDMYEQENIALPMDLNDDEMAEVESVSFPEQSKDMQSYLKSLDDHEFDEEVKEVFSKILSQSEILQQVAKEKREKEIAKVLDEVFGDQISNLMSDEI